MIGRLAPSSIQSRHRSAVLADATPRVFALPLLLVASAAFGTDLVFPREAWLRYDDPSRHGWSAERLEGARRFAEDAGVASYMIVENGYVVAAWGDVARRYRCHSVRKSFLSALVGMHVATGDIDPSSTIGELGIDDIHSLTPVEKTATVAQLLKARSGVYHPAAYETAAMSASRPERGSRLPGTHYYYNNWDFNVLGAIFIELTGKDLFVAFRDELARPLGMQDFRLIDTYYHLEPEYSIYPAYPFMLSTRDAARFGLLYLAEGRWNGKQVVPQDWVEATRTPWTRGARDHRGYGLLWWISEDPVLAELGMYHASGFGGQIIAVVPGRNLVLVQRVDTFRRRKVPYEITLELMKKIVAAKVAEAHYVSVVASPLESEDSGRIAVAARQREALAGTWTDRRGNPVMTVAVDESNDVIAAFRFDERDGIARDVRRFQGGQKFCIVATSEGGLELENAGYPIRLNWLPDGRVSRMTIIRPKRKVVLLHEHATAGTPHDGPR